MNTIFLTKDLDSEIINNFYNSTIQTQAIKDLDEIFEQTLNQKWYIDGENSKICLQ